MYGQHNYYQNPFAPLGCKVEAHMMPSMRDTWAKHTASGYYIGSLPEHYRCHVVYIICQTVFFKHKYLTQPSFTTNDALLLAADRLTTAIEGVLPTTTSTQAGVQQLLDIFKSQANGAKNEITAQRVQMADAAAQRVLDESTANEIARAETATQRVLEERTKKEVFQVITDDDHTEEADSSVPMITQDEDEEQQQPINSRPRTRSTPSATDEFIYSMMELPGMMGVTPRAAASRKFPMQFLCDCANAVIDGETGEIMEYRHLLKNLKHRKRWQKVFSREIRRISNNH
jgi:hypothetical protein